MSNLQVIWNGTQEFTVKESLFPDHTYHVVTEVPPGYFVWNVGTESMPEGYLPLCHWANPVTWTWPGENKVNTDTLCAIKMRPNHVRAIFAAADCGVYRPSDAREFIEQHKDAKRGTDKHKEVQVVKKALPYLNELYYKHAQKGENQP